MYRDEEQYPGGAEALALNLEPPKDGPDGTAPPAQVALLVRARWVVLCILCVYALYAGQRLLGSIPIRSMRSARVTA